MSYVSRWEVQVCGVPSRNFNHWSVSTAMYTKPVDGPGLAAPPVSTLEARPTRVSCAALSLILVKTSWNGLSASRDSHERGLHLWQNLLYPVGYSSGRRRGWCVT